MRKGLDKSTANNSSGLHYVEGLTLFDPKETSKKVWKNLLHGSTFEDRKKIAGFVYNENTENKDDADENRRYREKEEGDAASDGLSNRDIPASRKRDETVGATSRGRGTAGKNYTLAEVDELVKAFLSRFHGSTLVSDNRMSYEKFLYKLQQGTAWGPRLGEFANFKG